MPCDSRVVNTQMVDQDQLAEALTALGATNVEKSATRVAAEVDGRYVNFGRGIEKAGGKRVGFQTDMTDIAKLREIQRKYSEIGIRTLAKRKGYTVQTDETGRKFTLTNRRK